MTDNLNLEQQTQDIAQTISWKKESWISLWIRELMATIRGWSEKTEKKTHSQQDNHQISEKEEQYENWRRKERPPIVPSA